MWIIYNNQNAPNKPKGSNSAGSNRKTEVKAKSKGKGARFIVRSEVEI